MQAGREGARRGSNDSISPCSFWKSAHHICFGFSHTQLFLRFSLDSSILPSHKDITVSNALQFVLSSFSCFLVFVWFLIMQRLS